MKMENIDFNIQTDWLNSWSQKLQEIIRQLSSQETNEMIKLLIESKQGIVKSLLLENLKKNYITVEEDVEVLWFRWRKIHVYLPAIWKFKWFKFDYFAWDEKDDKSHRYNCTEYDFERNSELIEKSYSYEEIDRLYTAIREYFSEFEIKIDNDDLRKLLYLNSTYFLRDRYPKLDCCCGYFFLTLFQWSASDYMPNYCLFSTEKGANLLLKISE